MLVSIPRCYDSHVHFLATGQVLEGLHLGSLRNPVDVANIEIKPNFFRGEWLVGFGWDQHHFKNQKWPSKDELDQAFPDFPVAFSRADGHAVWVNSQALSLAGYLSNESVNRLDPDGGMVLRDSMGQPTGILIDSAKLAIDALIPAYSKNQNREFCLSAQKYFLSRGFTHLRDMTGTLEQWALLKELDESGQLSLYVEMNFVIENPGDLDRALQEAQTASNQTKGHLRVDGLKIFLDGALGSEGAFLSKPYANSANRGLLIWDMKDFSAAVQVAWAHNFPISVHCIGDQAAHEAALVFKKLAKQNITGKICFEHAELMRQETVDLLVGLDVTMHMQPCHYLSDRAWLKGKVSDLFADAFPWQRFQQAGFKLQWGSDSPIEAASVENNLQALRLSAKDGIPPLTGDPLSFHSHPDPSWGINSISNFSISSLDPK